MCPPQKWAKTQPPFWTDKFILLYTNITIIYIQTSCKQHLFGVLFFEKPNKTRTDQGALLKVFCSVGKETADKVLTLKSISSIAYVFGIPCLDKCFSFHVLNERHSFSFKTNRYAKVIFNCHDLAFFETSNLKKVAILFFISRILILKRIARM